MPRKILFSFWASALVVLLAAGLLALAACSPPAVTQESVRQVGIPSLVTATLTRPYHTLTSINRETSSPSRLNGTVTRTPTITLTPTASEGQPLVIGFSAGGLPLEVYRFGQGPTRLMIVAGIHGGYEGNTVALADELIVYLRDHPTLVPRDRTLYLLRVLNPDGYARSQGPQGRSNAGGVDLNRNWDAFWKPDFQKPGCWNRLPLSAGAFPGSEPETQALEGFILGNNIQVLISYHSAGLGIFAGGQPPDPISKELAQRLSRVSGYLFPPRFTPCTSTGQLVDWASAHEIAAVDVELNNHAETDFAINLRVIKMFLAYQPLGLSYGELSTETPAFR